MKGHGYKHSAGTLQSKKRKESSEHRRRSIFVDRKPIFEFAPEMYSLLPGARWAESASFAAHLASPGLRIPCSYNCLEYIQDGLIPSNQDHQTNPKDVHSWLVVQNTITARCQSENFKSTNQQNPTCYPCLSDSRSSRSPAKVVRRIESVTQRFDCSATFRPEHLRRRESYGIWELYFSEMIWR